MSITLKSRGHEEPRRRLMLMTLPSQRFLHIPINGVPLTSTVAAPSCCSVDQHSSISPSEMYLTLPLQLLFRMPLGFVQLISQL